MNEDSMKRMIEAARGERPADLLLRNLQLVNVFTGNIEACAIAIADGYIVGLGAYEALKEYDLGGRYVTPGFIDAHVHIESAMVAPALFAGAVLPHGTTAVVADPHEIANVLGAAGIDYMLAAGRDALLNFFFTLPSCVPATEMETSGARLTADALLPFMDHPQIVALAEMMNFPGVIQGDSQVLEKIAAMQKARKPVDGHSPGLSGQRLNAYLTTGIGSDHECTSAAEAREKLAAGMHIMVREGTGARNLDELLPVVTPQNSRRMMWCTDDRHPHDLLAQGHIDSMVRRAVQGGLDPIIAIQMATLNPAEYFRLNDVGAVAPGRRADLVVMKDLKDPVVDQVFLGGKLVARDGRVTEEGRVCATAMAPSAMAVPVERLDFRVPADGRRIRVIQIIPDQVVTAAQEDVATINKGLALADPQRDLAKIAVVERYNGSGRTGIGFVRGFGLRNGALAATVAHDSHNVILVGTNDEDMHVAAKALVGMGGGMVATNRGEVIARLALPIAGLMSDQPITTVCGELDRLLSAARQLGVILPDPFMTLSFLALPVIPALKITDHGLVDVDAFKPVPLFVDG